MSRNVTAIERRIRRLVERAIEREGAYPGSPFVAFDQRGGACLLGLCLVGAGRRGAVAGVPPALPWSYLNEAAEVLGITADEAGAIEAGYMDSYVGCRVWAGAKNADLVALGDRLGQDYLGQDYLGQDYFGQDHLG